MHRQIKMSVLCFFGIIVTSGFVNLFILYFFSNAVVIYVPSPVINLLDRRSGLENLQMHSESRVDRPDIRKTNYNDINSIPIVSENKTNDSLLTTLSEKNPLIDQDICKGNKILLTILIFSSPRNIESRNVIRETWLSDINSLIRYAFVVATDIQPGHKKQIQEESEQYKDIIHFDFVDSYQNLTFKTVSSFKWVVKRCPLSSFVLKIDDDMWLNTKALTSTLANGGLKGALGGSCTRAANPIRDPSNKYYIPEDVFPDSVYPPFCSGTGYVADMDVIRGIVNVTKFVPFFPLEDIYVALCMKKLEAKVLSLYGFNSVHVRANPCWLKSNWLITTHEFRPYELRRVWRTKCKGLMPIGPYRHALRPDMSGPLMFKRKQLQRLSHDNMFRRNARRQYGKRRSLIFN